MKRRQKQNGYTLLEALMAMAILGMAAAGVLLPFVSAASVQQDATARVIAAKLAADRMEEIVYAASIGQDIITSPYTDPEWPGQVQKASGDIFSGPVYDRFSRFLYCETVTVGSVDMVLVTITVKYDANKTPADTTDDREMMVLKFLVGPY